MSEVQCLTDWEGPGQSAGICQAKKKEYEQMRQQTQGSGKEQQREGSRVRWLKTSVSRVR